MTSTAKKGKEWLKERKLKKKNKNKGDEMPEVSCACDVDVALCHYYCVEQSCIFWNNCHQ